MSKPRDYHNAPPAHSSTKNPESLPPLVDTAKQYSPIGVKETLLASMSRVAVRLLDRVTGRAYSADELPAYLAPSVAAAIAADRALHNPFDGEPVIFDDADAATAMTASYEADTGKTILLTAKTVGVLDPAPSLDLVNPAEADAVASLTENTETRVVTVTLGTDALEAITTDLDALAVLLAGSAIIGGVVGVGDGATICTDSTTTLTGGTNADPEHLGTPAKLGRIATDGTDVWTAMKDDLTGTDSTTWVKTFTATP